MIQCFSLRTSALLLALVAIGSTTPATSAEVTVLDVDLAAKIRTADTEPDRFAIDVAHAVDSATDGEWTESETTATWRFGIRVPGAVSLSFHAAAVSLPAGSRITVRGRQSEFAYYSADIRGGSLWSRISKGDELTLEITVPVEQRGRTVFQIDRFQVGYRSLDGSLPQSSPQFRIQSVGEAGSCQQNYACVTTANNAGPARATVGLVIANQYECTGTLLNNVSGDNTAYVLTARHCQPGTQGAGNPASAADVTVYWNSLTACGEELRSLYNGLGESQTGAVTVVEQEDLWLIRLLDNPVIDNAYFAGFDATGGVVQGGYTPHHAAFRTKQLANWFGQAVNRQDVIPVLGGHYTSHLLGVVNQAGSIEGGASGGALFDQNDRVTGVLSLTAASGPLCAADPPSVPSPTHAAAFFTTLAASWDSTADTTSSTGNVTFKSVLDPDDTGTLVVGGAAAKAFVRIYTTTGITDASVGFEKAVNWNSFGATACTATGGVPGDGWTGTQAGQGQLQVIENAEGPVNYGIRCTYPDGHVSTAQITITWRLPAPYVNLQVDRTKLWVTRPVRLTWSSNVEPCQITGGSAAATNLSASGSATITESAAGVYGYSVRCGSGDRSINSWQAQVEFVPPSVTLVANSTDRHFDAPLLLEWSSAADTCTPSGGAPGDNWSQRQFGPSITRHTTNGLSLGLGSFTYRLTCTSGPLSAQAEVTIAIEDGPLYATLVASELTAAVGEPITMSWKSNGNCHRPDAPFSVTAVTGGDSEGSVTFLAAQPGTLTIRLGCALFGYPIGSFDPPPVQINVLPQVTSTLFASLTTLKTGESFTLSWTIDSATSCTASGGGADGGSWTGALELPKGSKTIAATTAGAFTYKLDCVGLLPRLTHHAEQMVTVTAAPPPSNNGGGNGSASSGGGGGGAFDRWTLFALTLMGVLGLRTRRLTTASSLR